MATITIQDDEDGTELVFDDSVYSAAFNDDNEIELTNTSPPRSKTIPTRSRSADRL